MKENLRFQKNTISLVNIGIFYPVYGNFVYNKGHYSIKQGLT